MQEKIPEPTVGRVVWWYHNSSGPNVPMVALVASVHPTEPLTINAAAFSRDGEIILGGVKSLRHKSEAGDDATVWWDWMPYQRGQAAKTEALQAELDRKAQA